jgi:hypothetical protein
MDRRLDVWEALTGDRRLAELALQIAAPFHDYRHRISLEPPRRLASFPSWTPLEKLPAAALIRLRVAGGLLLIKGWPWANNVPEDLAEACRLVLYFELGNGFIKHRKGEPVIIPHFGWAIVDGAAAPVCPVIFEFYEDDWSCCAKDRLGALDPLTGELFNTARWEWVDLVVGYLKSFCRHREGWYGTGYFCLKAWSEISSEPPPIMRKDQQRLRSRYKPTRWLVSALVEL